MEKRNYNDHQMQNDLQNENPQQQAVDKAPGEERGQGEKVTNADLKGKKVDADLEKESDRPLERNSTK